MTDGLATGNGQGTALTPPPLLSARWALWLFGPVTALTFFATCTWLFLFLYQGPRGDTGTPGLALDLLLLATFAGVHSFFLRVTGNRVTARIVPGPLRVLHYTWVSSLLLVMTMAAWQPVGGLLYEVGGTARTVISAVYAAGWLLMLASVADKGPFRHIGVEQWWCAMRHQKLPLPRKSKRGPFAIMRHPIYLAFFIMLWATPVMQLDRMVLAVAWTVYLFYGVVRKERGWPRLERTPS